MNALDVMKDYFLEGQSPRQLLDKYQISGKTLQRIMIGTGFKSIRVQFQKDHPRETWHISRQ